MQMMRNYRAVTRANPAPHPAPAPARTTSTVLLGGALMLLAACGGSDRRREPNCRRRSSIPLVSMPICGAPRSTRSGFAPLLQADSSGGVIVTDWYANPANPGERVKLTVTILDQDLRADALRVAASRQVSESGNWGRSPGTGGHLCKSWKTSS